MEKIGVAVNSYGEIGKRIADAVAKHKDMELVGVADGMMICPQLLSHRSSSLTPTDPTPAQETTRHRDSVACLALTGPLHRLTSREGRLSHK
jgi:glyceraldehyde-3-phosphate dehydrogenase/erythrose-4-phosphate dehydrogenase